MFVFGRPEAVDLERVRSEQAPLKVTYGEVGATRGRLPDRYRHDRHVVELGVGEDVYQRAIEGLHGWEAHWRAGLMLVPVRPPVRTEPSSSTDSSRIEALLSLASGGRWRAR
jgi:uncharacterized protein (UPF0548 family)